jgi:ring-1,2-phenylacetyl-CoA epoxidase subunit PaaC
VKPILKYTLRIADDSLILGQRLSEWCGHGPIIEEDIAMTNISLDLIGQALSLFEYAAQLDGSGKTADDFAFLRYENQYYNVQLVEQTNGDFSKTMVRQWLFDSFRIPFYEALQDSEDMQLAAIAEKSLKETKYHWKHSSEWIIRMGDGTEESGQRVEKSISTLWKFADELFYMDEVDQSLLTEGIAVNLESIRPEFMRRIKLVLDEAGIEVPAPKQSFFCQGRIGKHSEHMGHLLAQMQYMQRAYPNCEW